MSHSAQATGTADHGIKALREAWLAAIKAGDANRIAAMVTDDVVVVHGDGRAVRGREELKADFRNTFKAFSIEQTILNPQVTIRGDWAFEIAEVQSTLTPIRGAVPIHVTSMTMVALHRQSTGDWKVARVVGMLNQPAPGDSGTRNVSR